VIRLLIDIVMVKKGKNTTLQIILNLGEVLGLHLVHALMAVEK
jgi:hypothetical protein